jgi:hypothetical protein
MIQKSGRRGNETNEAKMKKYLSALLLPQYLKSRNTRSINTTEQKYLLIVYAHAHVKEEVGASRLPCTSV